MKTIDGKINKNGCEYYYMAEYVPMYVDDSFDHDFGTEYRGHFAVDSYEINGKTKYNLIITSLFRADDDREEEINDKEEFVDIVVEDINTQIN